MLQSEHGMDATLYAQFLCVGLSQSTLNVICAQLGVSAKQAAYPDVDAQERIDYYLKQAACNKPIDQSN